MTITLTAGHRRRAWAQDWPYEAVTVCHDPSGAPARPAGVISLSVVVADAIRQACAEAAGRLAVSSARRCAPVAGYAPDASPATAELMARGSAPAPARHRRPSTLQETPQASRQRRALICRPASPGRTVNHPGTPRRRLEEAR
jgi:hypothetical protein